jgi:hypothetical protein
VNRKALARQKQQPQRQIGLSVSHLQGPSGPASLLAAPVALDLQTRRTRSASQVERLNLFSGACKTRKFCPAASKGRTHASFPLAARITGTLPTLSKPAAMNPTHPDLAAIATSADWYHSSICRWDSWWPDHQMCCSRSCEGHRILRW